MIPDTFEDFQRAVLEARRGFAAIRISLFFIDLLGEIPDEVIERELLS